MKKLTRGQIVSMHGELISAHGGGEGLRDEDMLESALAAPFQTFNGQEHQVTYPLAVCLLGF